MVCANNPGRYEIAYEQGLIFTRSLLKHRLFGISGVRRLYHDLNLARITGEVPITDKNQGLLNALNDVVFEFDDREAVRRAQYSEVEDEIDS